MASWSKQVSVGCPWGHTTPAQQEFVRSRVCSWGTGVPVPSSLRLSQSQQVSLGSPAACRGAGTHPHAMWLPAAVSPAEGHMMPLSLCNAKLEGWIKRKHKQTHFIGAREQSGHAVATTRTPAVSLCLWKPVLPHRDQQWRRRLHNFTGHCPVLDKPRDKMQYGLRASLSRRGPELPLPWHKGHQRLAPYCC